MRAGQLAAAVSRRCAAAMGWHVVTCEHTFSTLSLDMHTCRLGQSDGASSAQFKSLSTAAHPLRAVGQAATDLRCVPELV